VEKKPASMKKTKNIENYRYMKNRRFEKLLHLEKGVLHCLQTVREHRLGRVLHGPAGGLKSTATSD